MITFIYIQVKEFSIEYPSNRHILYCIFLKSGSERILQVI